MQVAAKSAGSTEAKINFLARLFLLQAYLDELDATTNGPAAYSSQPWLLSERDWELVRATMLAPPEPSEALISLFREYGSLNKSD